MARLISCFECHFSGTFKILPTTYRHGSFLTVKLIISVSVGVMSSTEFASVITNCLGKRVAANFKALMFSTSTLRNSPGPSQTWTDLSFVADYAGSQILHQLEKHISSRKFRLSLPTRLGLFLVLVGSVIATKYYQEFVQVTIHISFHWRQSHLQQY
jgi:hypothetical protein